MLRDVGHRSSFRGPCVINLSAAMPTFRVPAWPYSILGSRRPLIVVRSVTMRTCPGVSPPERVGGFAQALRNGPGDNAERSLDVLDQMLQVCRVQDTTLLSCANNANSNLDNVGIWLVSLIVSRLALSRSDPLLHVVAIAGLDPFAGGDIPQNVTDFSSGGYGYGLSIHESRAVPVHFGKR